MDELGDYLVDILKDARQGRDVHRLANHLLRQWRAGVVPSPRVMHELRKMLDRPNVCARLQPDGTCRWLRKFGYLEGIPRPGPGEKVRCHRKLDGTDVERYDSCAGFRKLGAT